MTANSKLPLVILLLLILVPAFAHQPRIVWDKQAPVTNPIIIENPEVSQAFYGELKGHMDHYLIVSDKEFLLYTNILSPAIQNADKDFNVDIYQDLKPFAKINSQGFNWTLFHEEFANDNYWQGPEFEQTVPAGEYLLRVTSPDDAGKYVLVIGKEESFPRKEMLNALVLIPRLKSNFFGTSILTFFESKIGILLLEFTAAIVFMILLIYVLIKYIAKKHKKEKTHKSKIKKIFIKYLKKFLKTIVYFFITKTV